MAWSLEKKKWCCLVYQQGCKDADPEAPEAYFQQAGGASRWTTSEGALSGPLRAAALALLAAAGAVTSLGLYRMVRAFPAARGGDAATVQLLLEQEIESGEQ